MATNVESTTPTPISSEQELVNMGYTNLKLNARILARTGGDVSKAAQILQKKTKQSTDANPFDEGADALVSLGFLNRKENLRILARTKGNLEEATAILKKKSEKKNCGKNKAEKNMKCPPDVPSDKPSHEATPNPETPLTPETIDPLMEEKLKQLRESGFADDEGNRKLLKNTGGDVQVVQAFLTAKAKLHETIREAKNERKRKIQSEKERIKAFRHLAKVQKTTPVEKTVAEMENLSLSQERPSVIPKDCTRIIVDGSNLIYQLPPLRKLAIQEREIHKAASVIERMARKLTDISGLPTLLLFDESSRSVAEPNFELQSAAPSFTHSGTAILAKIVGERSPLVVTADQQLGSQLDERGVARIRPFQWVEEVAKGFEPLQAFKTRKEVIIFLRQQITACV